MSPVTLIARREIVSRWQQRSYRISFGIGLLIVVIACVAPALFSGDSAPKHYDVAVAVERPGLTAALVQTGRAQKAEVTVHRADAATATARVRSGAWDAAVLPGGRVLAAHATDTVVGVVRGGYQLADVVQRLTAAGLSPTQIARALDIAPLRAQGTDSAEQSQRESVAIIAVIVLFSQLITFCTWMAMGVVEEKSSRVVELVLSSVRPLQLLTGKLLGIGLLAAAQVLALGVVALAASSAAGTLTLPASALVTVAISFVAFVLGFAFFGSLSAGLASTVSRQEEVSGILAPITITLTLCYGVGFAVATHPEAGWARTLSLIPPISVIALPARIAHGAVSALDVVLAVVLLLLAAAAITAAAARVYRASVLHSGTRVPLRRAWRGEPAGS